MEKLKEFKGTQLLQSFMVNFQVLGYHKEDINKFIENLVCELEYLDEDQYGIHGTLMFYDIEMLNLFLKSLDDELTLLDQEIDQHAEDEFEMIIVNWVIGITFKK